MEKSKLVRIPLFIIIFSVIIVSMHYSNIDFDTDSMFKIKNLSEIINDLTISKEIVSILQQDVFECEDEIQMIKQDLDNLIAMNLEHYANISQLKIVCGKTDVRGPGITIKVADNLTDDYFNINDKIVHDFDVRTILNELNKAGAEAIAINGKRIVNTTEVICIGPVIRVNGEAVASPFIIKAIGDPDTLMDQVIMSPQSYAYDIKTNYGIDITAIKSYDINISRNKEKMKVNFARLNEEGE